MRVRVADLRTLDQVERELDRSLTELRAVNGTSNTIAISSVEYRIGALRRRKQQMEAADRPRAASVN